MTFRVSLLGLGSLAALAFAMPAYAETLDYGAMENVFGEPVTAAATGLPQKSSEVPADMTIITANEIRQSGSRSIPDILSRVPGLNILQSAYNVTDVGVRGYQQPFQPRLLVLVDGRQVFLDDYARTAWDNIPVNVDDIRQIEVVIGASSALFGSNAAGGVINIVTYSPLYDNNNVVNLTAGTQNTLTGDATGTIKGDWGGSKFTVGGLRANEFATDRYALDQPATRPEHQYVTNSSIVKLTPDVQAFGEFTFSNSAGNTGDPTDNFTVGAEKVTTYSLRGGMHWNTRYGLLTSDTYLNHSFVSLAEPTDGGSPYTFGTDLIDSKLEDRFRLNNDNVLRVGLEYKHKIFHMSGAQVIEPASPQLEENNYALNGTWAWQINDRLSWTIAARLEHLDMEETGTLIPDSINTTSDYSHVINAWSGNSDIVYKATDLDTFHIGYGRGLQLPSLINSGYGLYQYFVGQLSEWEGNPHLKPTVVQDYGLNYTRKLPELASFMKLGAFYELNQDIVSPLQAVDTVTLGGQPGVTFGESLNAGNSRAYGGEMQFKGGTNGFRWDGSYSFSRVSDSESVAQFLAYQSSAPQHTFRVATGYTTGAWEFDVHARYVTSTDMLRSTDGGNTFAPIHTDDYLTTGGRIGYKINDHITAAITGFSLNKNKITESPYPAVERQVFLSLTGKF